MRDVGTFVWVILVVVGVVGSMISSVRRQVQGQKRAGPAAPPQYPPGVSRLGAPVPPAPAAAQPRPQDARSSRPAPHPAQPLPAHPADEVRLPRRRFFAGKRGLVAAVIAAEVLGKPRGLSDEQFPR